MLSPWIPEGVGHRCEDLAECRWQRSALRAWARRSGERPALQLSLREIEICEVAAAGKRWAGGQIPPTRCRFRTPHLQHAERRIQKRRCPRRQAPTAWRRGLDPAGKEISPHPGISQRSRRGRATGSAFIRSGGSGRKPTLGSLNSYADAAEIPAEAPRRIEPPAIRSPCSCGSSMVEVAGPWVGWGGSHG